MLNAGNISWFLFWKMNSQQRSKGTGGGAAVILSSQNVAFDVTSELLAGWQLQLDRFTLIYLGFTFVFPKRKHTHTHRERERGKKWVLKDFCKPRAVAGLILTPSKRKKKKKRRMKIRKEEEFRFQCHIEVPLFDNFGFDRQNCSASPPLNPPLILTFNFTSKSPFLYQSL